MFVQKHKVNTTQPTTTVAILDPYSNDGRKGSDKELLFRMRAASSVFSEVSVVVFREFGFLV